MSHASIIYYVYKSFYPIKIHLLNRLKAIAFGLQARFEYMLLPVWCHEELRLLVCDTV